MGWGCREEKRKRMKFCMLDELDSGLDIESAGKISQILADYKKETGASFLITSHNLRILEKLKMDKVVELVGGKLVVVENERSDEKSARVLDERSAMDGGGTK